MEILNYGIGGPNHRRRESAPIRRPTPSSGCSGCATTTGRRVRTPQGANSVSTDYWPNMLFDTREALQRDVTPPAAPANIALGGVMHYVTSTRAICRGGSWAPAPYTAGTGNQAKTDNSGYTALLLRPPQQPERREPGDRRIRLGGLRQPAAPTGAPNGTLDPGEDVNANNVARRLRWRCRTTTASYNSVPPGALAPLDDGRARRRRR